MKNELLSIRKQLEIMNKALAEKNTRCEHLKEQKKEEVRKLSEAIQSLKQEYPQLQTERAQNLKARDECLLASCFIF